MGVFFASHAHFFCPANLCPVGDWRVWDRLYLTNYVTLPSCYSFVGAGTRVTFLDIHCKGTDGTYDGGVDSVIVFSDVPSSFANFTLTIEGTDFEFSSDGAGGTHQLTSGMAAADLAQLFVDLVHAGSNQGDTITYSRMSVTVDACPFVTVTQNGYGESYTRGEAAPDVNLELINLTATVASIGGYSIVVPGPGGCIVIQGPCRLTSVDSSGNDGNYGGFGGSVTISNATVDSIVSGGGSINLFLCTYHPSLTTYGSGTFQAVACVDLEAV